MTAAWYREAASGSAADIMRRQIEAYEQLPSEKRSLVDEFEIQRQLHDAVQRTRECPGHARALWADGSRRRGNRGGRGGAAILDADGRASAQAFEARVAALFAKSPWLMVNSGSSATLPCDRAARAAGGRRSHHAGPDVRDHGGAARQARPGAGLRRRRARHVQHRRRADRGDDRADEPARSIDPVADRQPARLGPHLPRSHAAHASSSSRIPRTRWARRCGAPARHALGHQHDELLRLARHQLRRQRRHALRQSRRLGRRGAPAAQLGAKLVTVRRIGERRRTASTSTSAASRTTRSSCSQRIGYNLEPSEIGAAFGLVQLDRLAVEHRGARQPTSARTRFFADYEDWFDAAAADARTAGPAGSPSPHRPRRRAVHPARLQIFLEAQGIQTRTVFTGNILRQPGFADIERRETAGGYPNADRVMRGGMLVACHHGLSADAPRTTCTTRFRVFAATVYGDAHCVQRAAARRPARSGSAATSNTCCATGRSSWTPVRS